MLLHLRALRVVRRLPLVEEIPAVAPGASLPSLSVVVPACNEEQNVEAGLRSLLAQDYPGLHVVAVNDRSDDRTGEILDQLASEFSGLQVIHIADLPPGWLGKTNALARATEACTSDFVLYTDADVIFAPGVLKRCVAHVEANELDHLAVIFKGLPPNIVVDTIECGLGALASARMRMTRKKKTTVFGSGPFALVRKRVLDRAEGFAWMKMDVSDDFALALMLRRAGAKAKVMLSRNDIACQWYPSTKALVSGFEKNFFPTIARFNPRRARIIAILIVGLNAGLFLPAVVPAMWPHLTVVYGTLGAVLGVSALLRAMRTRRNMFALMLAPLGQFVVAYILVRSAWVCVRRGGIQWRSTFYALDDLRRGQVTRL